MDTAFFLTFDLIDIQTLMHSYKAFVANPALLQFTLKCIPEHSGKVGSLYCLRINWNCLSDYENREYWDLNKHLFK